jgi:hypothetical protein
MTGESTKLPSKIIEDGLDIGATLINLVPWLGGAVANVLTGIANDRRLKRVDDVLATMGKELADFESVASEEYVKKDEFEDLLDLTLRQSSNERSERMRKVYSGFLIDAIKQPRPYDEQRQVLLVIGQMQHDHFRVLGALDMEPAPGDSWSGSPMATLQRRLSDMPKDHILELIGQIEGLRLASISPSLHVMMTPQGAEELRGSITRLGRKVLEFTDLSS